MRRLFFALTSLAGLATGCALPHPVPRSELAAPKAAPAPRVVACASCTSPVNAELAVAIERRVADLTALGGQCAVLGGVLERSYRSGQITVRPYMWRVGGQLASGEGRPDGTMVLAREIDSLNVGVRTLDDVVWTLEHEAAHIAFSIRNGDDANGDLANARVRACRPHGS